MASFRVTITQRATCAVQHESESLSEIDPVRAELELRSQVDDEASRRISC